MILEACATSASEAVRAVGGGAGRIELCRDLAVGGLTPTAGAVLETRQALQECGHGATPVFCMVRPRPGPFRAGLDAVEAMVREAAVLREAGADGLVFGVLDRVGRIDRTALAAFMEAAEGMPVTFHRAFDEIADPFEALEHLAAAGVGRILTGGGPGTAWEGRHRLRELVRVAAQHHPGVRILAAGSIRGDHVRALVEATGLTECHARASAFPALAEALGTLESSEASPE